MPPGARSRKTKGALAATMSPGLRDGHRNHTNPSLMSFESGSRKNRHCMTKSDQSVSQLRLEVSLWLPIRTAAFDLPS